MGKKSIDNLSPTKKALIISGLIFVAGASYWYFTRPNDDKDESNETPSNDVDIQETPVSIGQTDPFEPNVNENDNNVNKDDIPSEPNDIKSDAIQNHIEQIDETPVEEAKVEENKAVNDDVVKEQEQEEVVAEETVNVVVESEPVIPPKEVVVEDDVKEENDVVVVDKKDSVQETVSNEVDNNNDDDDKKEKAEEERLKERIKKYDDISAKVNKYEQYKYKNGKLKVHLLRATDIEDKDQSLRKGDFSDVLVNFKVPGSKHIKSKIIKDSKNP